MRAYTYKPEDVGLSAWDSGTLRLEGVEHVTDPLLADVFIFPGSLTVAYTFGLDRLPHMKGNEERHCFFECSDNFVKAIGTRAMLIKCDVREWMLTDDVNSIAFPWPVEDMPECIDLPAGGFKYDISAHMWTSTQTRIDSAQSCMNNPALKCDIALYSDFTGYLHDRATNQWTSEGIRRRTEFRRSMRESRIALCPESIPGVLPYRFFEAMSAGRVPLLVSSDFVLPWDLTIPYDNFCIFAARDEAKNADQIVLHFISTHTDEEIIEMGKQARRWWLELLNSADWPRTMAMAVEMKLKEINLLCA